MQMRSYENELTQPMLTVKEVAHLLHVHPSTVRRWEKQGLLRSYRLGPKRSIRFKPKDVAEFASYANNFQGGGAHGRKLLESSSKGKRTKGGDR